MFRPGWTPLVGGVAVLAFSSILTGQRPVEAIRDSEQLDASHADCEYFGPRRERFIDKGQLATRTRALSATTNQVARMLATVPGGSRTYSFEQDHAAGSIDFYIFADFQKNKITPAAPTTDWEFIRRVTLDLTGRIPSPDRVLSFVDDTTEDKRVKLIDELLAKPEWVDKWTMYFGDLYKNTTTRPSTGLNRYPEGRNAFYQYIYDSLAANKPYNRMATEMISASTSNTYQDGPSNFVLNGYMGGGPGSGQDSMDLATATVFETFMGMAHVNCLLCHNGRGHVDSLSLWAANVTRYQAWQLAGFFGRISMAQVRVDPANGNPYYWTVLDNRPTDYPLNTTTGNRPARVAPAGCRAGQPCYYVPPQYIFNGDAPRAGENYRAALARNITSDFQFARATVNYLWAYFFGRGLVDPPETFDPARLDPENPPPAPWTLQPSNAALLNALAQHFIDSGYDLKAVMREITSSDVYQLSSRYDGEWNIAWEPYFARKFVRRLWAEEIHDAVAQSSGTFPSYDLTGFTDRGFPKVSYAMQLPDVAGRVNEGNAANLLDAFIRGNRDDQPRKGEGSILQGLNLMNNPFILNRTHAAGASASALIVQNLSKNNTDLINTLYLNILSRYPTPEELAKSQAAIPASGNTRTPAVSDLVWSLYNKVDFVFNY